jgi:outer membrane lipoprotein-sorting protein
MKRGALLPFVLACLISLLATAQDKDERPGPEAILQKVQEQYGNLQSYHFEHTLVVREPAKDDDNGEEVARVDLTTISQRIDHGPGMPDLWKEMLAKGQLPFETNRMRMESKGKRGAFLLASDGTTAWAYNKSTGEYVARGGGSAIGPTAATMHAMLHVQRFGKYLDGRLKDAKALDDEEVKVGDETKRCYVIEGTVEPADMRSLLPPGVKPSASFPKTNPLQRVCGEYIALAMHGFVTTGDSARFYLPMEDVQPKLKLWIDQKEFIVWQSHFSEKVNKQTRADNDKQEKVLLTAVHKFSEAKINPKLPPDIFRFEPPPDAKKVEKFTEPKPMPMPMP